jgi:repressor LexA
MVRPVTKTQIETFKFIKEFIEANDFPPTRKEIAEHFNIYRNAADLRVRNLADKGLIQLIPAISRGIRIV